MRRSNLAANLPPAKTRISKSQFCFSTVPSNICFSEEKKKKKSEVLIAALLLSTAFPQCCRGMAEEAVDASLHTQHS